jgi:pimeloyl-ACP methyl ester carboxylesterase
MPSFTLHGAGIHYLDQGSGEPVILLHSSGASSAQWRALAEKLSARFRVLAPDLYGYGATANWPGHAAFSLGCEAEIVNSVLERVDRPVHLVGHSYGGAVALHLARTLNGLRSLTLIEPVAFNLLAKTDAGALAGINDIADTVRASLACGDYADGFGRFFDYWSGAGAWDAVPASRRGTLAAQLPKVALDFHALINGQTLLDDMRTLGVPTLLLSGTRSPLPTRRICELLAQVIPGSELQTVEGAGHMLPLTHREAVNAAIVTHLIANSGAPPRHAPPSFHSTRGESHANSTADCS